MMKYEIIKGSEKDFEYCHNDIVAVYVTQSSSRFYATKNYSIINSWHLIAERRPINEPVWDVSTPPPVGIECEVLFTSEGSVFERARILHVGDDGVVGRWLTGDSAGGLFDYAYVPHDYRNIRSLEDVARDEVGLAIYHAINWNSEGELVNPSRMEDYKKAYDAIAAGKIPGVTLAAKPAKQSDSECEHKNTNPTSGGCACNDCGWTSW